MSKEDTSALLKFLKPYPPEIQETVLWLRDFVWTLYPKTNELIYDNYNALALGWSLTDKAGDVFCSIAIYSEHVNFGFNRGSEIADPQKKLIGEGSLYRYIRIKDKDDFPEEYIVQLLLSAYNNAFLKLKPAKNTLKGQTIVKSISPAKRRPS